MVENKSFLLCVRQKFGYLEKEFAYKMTARLFESEPWSDGLIKFISPTTLVTVGKDRGSFWVLIKPSKEPEIAAQSLETIIESLSMMKEEKFPRGPVPPTEYSSTLGFYAQVLRQKCMPFIKGDFSLWTRVLNYHLKQMRKEFDNKLPAEFYTELEEYISFKEKTFSRRNNG